MANFPIKNLIPLIHKRFLSSTIPTLCPFPPINTSFTLQYLVKSCGLSPKSALSISQKLHLDENKLQRSDSVLKLLKSNGFDDNHIAKVVEKRPAILRCGVEKNLKLKVDYLTQIGFTGTLLAELIVSNPEIFTRSLNGQIKPTFEFLKELLGSNENVIVVIKRASWLLTTALERKLKRNTDFLINEGVPVSCLLKLVRSKPRIMLLKFDSTVLCFNAVKELGLEPKSPMFIYAFRMMMSLSETTLKNKREIFKSLGWTDEETLSMFKRDPLCFSLREDKIRLNMDFYTNTMKLEPEIIIRYPKLLTFGIDRIRLRYNILKLLESKELLKWDKKKVAWSLAYSEKRFFQNYVDKYKNDVPGLLEMYKGTAKAKK